MITSPETGFQEQSAQDSAQLALQEGKHALHILIRRPVKGGAFHGDPRILSHWAE